MKLKLAPTLGTLAIGAGMAVVASRQGNHSATPLAAQTTPAVVAATPLHLLVKLAPGVDVVSAMHAIGGTIDTTFGFGVDTAPAVYTSPELSALRYVLVDAGDTNTPSFDMSPAPIPAALQRVPGVVSVTADGTKHAYGVRGDPVTTLDPMVNGQWIHAKIGSADAWRRGYTGGGAVIAILDSGVDCSHEDIRCIHAGRDYTGGGSTADRLGHGTHVAGIASAKGGNNIGGSGIAAASVVLPVKVLGDDGNGSDSGIASGIVYAVDSGARVLNLSLGSDDPAPILDDALAYAVLNGALVTCAAGNSGTNVPSYPNTYAGCIGVAATKKDNEVGTTWTNWGVNADIGIGGEAIMSTYPGNRYAQMDGTSMAAPALAGVLAIAMQAGVPSRDVLALVNSTGVPLTGRLAGLRRPNLTALSAALDAIPDATTTARPSATRTATPRPTATRAPTRTPTRTRTPGVVVPPTATFRTPTRTAVPATPTPTSVPALGWPCVVVMTSGTHVTIRCPIAATAVLP